MIGNQFAAPSNKIDFQSRHYAREPLSLQGYNDYMKEMVEDTDLHRRLIN